MVGRCDVPDLLGVHSTGRVCGDQSDFTVVTSLKPVDESRVEMVLVGTMLRCFSLFPFFRSKRRHPPGNNVPSLAANYKRSPSPPHPGALQGPIRQRSPGCSPISYAGLPQSMCATKTCSPSAARPLARTMPVFGVDDREGPGRRERDTLCQNTHIGGQKR